MTTTTPSPSTVIAVAGPVFTTQERSPARLADSIVFAPLMISVSRTPGQTGNVIPVSSSETVHRRRWMVVSWDCLLDAASFG